MMKPLTLEEFAQQLRVSGDWREMEFADEILELITLEEDVAEPYSDLCADIEHYAKDFSNRDDAAKALEWIGDRSNLLAEVEAKLTEAGRDKGANGLPLSADDAVEALLAELATQPEYDL